MRKIDFNSEIWIPNLQIHKKAGLNPFEFLDKIQNVKYLRTSSNLYFTFYPCSNNEYYSNIELWEYVNGNQNNVGNFSCDGTKYFNIKFPSDLYWFLKSITKSEVNKFIVINIALIHIFEEYDLRILQEQLYDKIWNKVSILLETTFFVKLKKLKQEISEMYENFNDESENDREIFNAKIEQKERILSDLIFSYLKKNKFASIALNNLNIFHKVYGIDWCFIFYPRTEIIKDTYNYNVSLHNSYFLGRDWNNIVVKSDNDDMHRSESQAEPLNKFKEEYKFYHRIF